MKISKLFKFRYKYNVEEIEYVDWLKSDMKEATDYILLETDISDTFDICIETIMNKLYKKDTYEIIKESIELKTLEK